MKTFEDGINRAIELVTRWQEAYPEDIFAKNPRDFKELRTFICTQESYDTVITRASAHMGRHMAKILIEDLKAEITTGSEPVEK